MLTMSGVLHDTPESFLAHINRRGQHLRDVEEEMRDLQQTKREVAELRARGGSFVHNLLPSLTPSTCAEESPHCAIRHAFYCVSCVPTPGQCLLTRSADTGCTVDGNIHAGLEDHPDLARRASMMELMAIPEMRRRRSEKEGISLDEASKLDVSLSAAQVCDL